MQEEKLSEGCDLTHPCRKDTWFRIVVSSMARTGTTARTSTINRSTRPVLALDVSSYSCDLENWPRSWMGWDKDLPRDEGLVAGSRPFFQHVAAGGLSRKTIRRHLDNRWRAERPSATCTTALRRGSTLLNGCSRVRFVAMAARCFTMAQKRRNTPSPRPAENSIASCRHGPSGEETRGSLPS